MPYDRHALKRRARELLKTTQPSLLGTSAGFLIIFYVLQGADILPNLNGLDENAWLLRALFVEILTVLLTGVLRCGYSGSCLAVVRGEEHSHWDIFDGYRDLGHCAGCVLLMALFLILWSLLAFVPGLAVYLGGGLIPANKTMVWAGRALLLAGGALMIWVRLRYALVRFLVLDRPELGAMDTVRESKELMKGNKGKFLALWLSFLGWMVLAVLTAAAAEFAVLYFSGVFDYAQRGLLGYGIFSQFETLGTRLYLAGSLVSLAWLSFLLPYMELSAAEFYLYSKANR